MDPVKEGETGKVGEDCAAINSTDDEKAIETNLDVVVEPAVGMEFESDEAAHRFFNSYAKQVGFKTKIRQSQKNKKLGKCFVHFACSKEGFRETKENASKARSDIRCGCLASMKIRLNESGKWKVIEVKLDHNHSVCPIKDGSLEHLDDRGRKRLKLGIKACHRVQMIFQENVTVAGREHPTFEEGDYNDHVTEVSQLKQNHEDFHMMVPLLGGGETNQTRHTEGDRAVINSVDEEQVTESDSTECLVPSVGMEFESDEEAHRFFNSYAKRVGFKTKIRQSQKNKKLGKCFVHYACSKEGFKETKDTVSKARADTRCGCSAGMKVRLFDLGKWKVIEVNLQHNHSVGLTKPHNHSPTKVLPDKHLNVDFKKRLELYRLKRKKRMEFGVKTHQQVEKKVQKHVTDAGHEHLEFEQRDCQKSFSNDLQMKEIHEDPLMVVPLMEGIDTRHRKGECATITSVNKEQALEGDPNPCLAPVVGMEFESDGQAHRFFNSYAKQVGFTIRIRQSQKSKRLGRCFVHFSCNKEGFKETREAVTKTRPDTRCGCPAGMKIRLNEFGKWNVLEVNLQHNHLVNPTKVASHNDVDDRVAKGLKLVERTGQQMQKTSQECIMDAGHEHRAFGQSDCQNHSTNIVQSERSHDLQVYYGPAIVQSKPSPTDVAAIARSLVSLNSWGVLSTISSDMGGVPFGDVVPFSDGVPGNGHGIPYFYLATLDPTARNALKDDKSSFTISQFPLGACSSEDHENPTYTKLTLTGKLKLVDKKSKEVEFAELSLFSKHAPMKDWPKDQNFKIFKLAIENIFLIDWFGGTKPLTLAHYLHPRV